MTKNRKFYKRKPKKTEAKKLPSNSRTITEKLINDHSVFFIGIVCIVIAIVLVLYDFYKNFTMQEAVHEARREVIGDLNYWNREVIDKPSYRDGYLSLSLIYFRLGDLENSIENLDKAMSIDPNFSKGKELKKIIEDN